MYRLEPMAFVLSKVALVAILTGSERSAINVSAGHAQIKAIAESQTYNYQLVYWTLKRLVVAYKQDTYRNVPPRFDLPRNGSSSRASKEERL
jgi:predicted RecB family endonuclease